MEENGVESKSLEDLEAARYAWERVWEPMQDVKSSYDMLDVVRFDQQIIQGWLFTAADGLVKSKSRPRWRIEAVGERCCQDGSTFNAHAFIKDRWVVLNDFDELAQVSQAPTCKVILPFGYIGKSNYLVEHTWEAETNKRPPKVSTYRLSSQKQAGKTLVDDSKDYAIPPCKVLCHDKVLNEHLKSTSGGLLKIVQAKSRSKIKKLVCIFLVETPDASMEDRTPRVWLHHVKHMTLADKPGGVAGGGGTVSGNVTVRGTVRSLGQASYASEMKSVTTDVTHQSSSFLRTAKCHGDFCTYSEFDEYEHMRMDDGETGGAVHREVKKALGRHRRAGALKKSTWKERMAALVTSEEGAEKEFEVDVARAEAVGMSASLDSLSNALEDDFDDETALPKPKKSGAHKVPNKAVDLARTDMAELAKTGAVSKYAVWPEVLQHWFFRMGRSIVQKRVSKLAPTAVPLTSGHAIGSMILAQPIPEAGEENESVTSPNGSTARVSPISKASKREESKPIMTMDLAGNVIVDEMDDSVPFDLPGDHKVGGRVRRTVGQIATYYSETSVCAQCYQVYCELDKRRNSTLKGQLKERRRAIDDVENSEEKGREIERRIFQQRKFVSRLANTKVAKKSFMVGENGMAGMEGSMSMYGSAYGSLADPSWIGAQMGFNESSMASSMASRFPINGPSGPTKARAPKGALPPLPWQLKDKNKRKQYLEGGGSFVKNIGSKAQEMKEIVKQEKLLSDLQYRRDIKAAERRGDNSGEKFDWEKITGKAAQLRSEAHERDEELQRRLEQREQEAAKMRAIPKFDPMRLMHPHHRHLANLQSGMDPKQAELAANLPANKAGYGSIKPTAKSEVERRGKKMSALQKVQARRRKVLQDVTEDESGAPMQRTMSAGTGDFASSLGQEMLMENMGDIGMATSYENDERFRNQQMSPSAARQASPKRAALKPTSPTKPTDPLASLNKYSALSGATRCAPAAVAVADDDDYDEDDDDEEIGWSPFVVNLNE